ncbi:MAG TPA: phosphatase PAP2 family protein [Spirochaetota bacterium]|nr:phosphatase PAP2 family protein [Spirochaetota bacterium]HPQ53110.1 phosphatase PAP2 family protein [Spirochaetota bacterium]
MNNGKAHVDILLEFRLEEILSACMIIVLNSLILTFSDFSKTWMVFFLNLSYLGIIAGAAYTGRQIGGRGAVFRDWYVMIILIMIYMEHQFLVPLVNPHDIDNTLIILDRAMFAGHDPTVLLERITVPVLTEFLQIVYASFYFLPFVLCLLVYRRGRRSDYHITASTIMLGFYLSYAGYYLCPAIGPQYTLDHLQGLPLSGLLTFECIRNLLGTLGGVARDCFPSGHTLVSVLTMLLAFRFHRSFAKIAVPWSALLVFATVYLRYHYVADVLAGLAIALVTWKAGPALASWYLYTRGRRYPAPESRADSTAGNVS